LIPNLECFFHFHTHGTRTMSDDGMLHLSNAPNLSTWWSPANVVKVVCGFVLFVLLIVIAHGQNQTANELRRLNLESSPQVKYEYLVESASNPRDNGQLDSKYLNDKASQGWILDQFGLGIKTAYGYEAKLIFKRPL